MALGTCVGRVTEAAAPISTEPPPELPKQELPAPEKIAPPQAKDSPAAPKEKAPAVQAVNNPAIYYQQVEQMPVAQVMAAARRALERVSISAPRQFMEQPERSGVVGIVRHAMISPNDEGQTATAVASFKPAPVPVPISPMPIQSTPTLVAVPPVAATPLAPAPVLTQPRIGSSVTVPISAAPMPIPTQPQSGSTAPAPISAVSKTTNPMPTAWANAGFYPGAGASPPVVERTPVPQAKLAPPAQPARPVILQAQNPQPAEPDIAQLASVLKNAFSAEERRQAVERLGSCDRRNHPQVVQLLVTYATLDAAPVVRAECIRSLSRMNANTPAVLAVLQDLREDRDGRVRTEANRALARLAPAQPGTINSSIQPVGTLGRPQ
jgi:hypothetical protein